MLPRAAGIWPLPRSESRPPPHCPPPRTLAAGAAAVLCPLSPPRSIPVQRVTDQVGGWGFRSQSVEATARTITAAERDGCKSHGLFRLPGYCNALRAGKSDPQVMRVQPGCSAAAGCSLPALLDVATPACPAGPAAGARSGHVGGGAGGCPRRAGAVSHHPQPSDRPLLA